jgi:hypothetical protein
MSVLGEPYPHDGGCSECRSRQVCNVCGYLLSGGVCTNGRCLFCHGRVCTPGGETAPGHGFGSRGAAVLASYEMQSR